MSNTQKTESKKWSDRELEVLYSERMKGTPYKIIAKILKRSERSVESKYNSGTIDWASMSFYDQEKVEQRRNNVLESAEKRNLKISDSLDKFRLSADIIGDKLAEAARRLPVAPLPPTYKKTKDDNRTAEHMGLILSDIHIGHEHSLEETGGLSEYNIDTFKKRLENLKQAITDIYGLHSKLYKLPKLHIFSLGDIVEGCNTAGAWSHVWIDTPIFDQVMIGYRELSDFVYYMLTMFEEVEIYALYGNHGRIAPNGAEKKYNNFDLFCYKYMELELKNQPRVKMNIAKTWWMMKDIQNHKFLMVHGDDVKSKNPPVTSLLDLEKKMTGITKQIPNYTLCGHFHNCSEFTTHNGKALMNGCFLPDTKVYVEGGVRKRICDIQKGEKTIGKNLEYTLIEETKKSSYSGEIVGMRMSGNAERIKATPNHQFLAVKASRINDIPMKNTEEGGYNPLKDDDSIIKIIPEYIEISKLSKGDYIAVAMNSNDNLNDIDSGYYIENEPLKMDKDIARMIGLYLAEGSSSGQDGNNYHSTFSFNIAEKHFGNFVKEVIADKFKFGERVKIFERPHKSILEVVINSKQFSEWIVDICGKGCHNKKLKSSFFDNLSKDLQKEILIGYLQGDGHVCKTNSSQSVRVMAASVSENLRDQMAMISNNLGYSPLVRKQNIGGRRKSISYWISFGGQDSIDIAKEMGKPFIMQNIKQVDRNYIYCDKYKLVKISQIWTEQYVGDVYDLQVADQESFNVEGVICHNSFVGSDVYSLSNCMPGNAPEQKLFGIHPKIGITWTYNVNLNHERK